MQPNIPQWIKQFTDRLCAAFGEQLLCVGLQGSYGRGEATESSDIDVVVVLEDMPFSALEQYRLILAKMPLQEKICGFISGREELLGWEKSDYSICTTIPMCCSAAWIFCVR